MDPADLKLWAQKWRHYERNSLPWNRARIHLEFARRRAFCRWPVHGNVLELLRDGRLELGEHVLLEPGVWLTAPAPGRIVIGAGTFLNLGDLDAEVEEGAAADADAAGRHRRQPHAGLEQHVRAELEPALLEHLEHVAVDGPAAERLAAGELEVDPRAVPGQRIALVPTPLLRPQLEPLRVHPGRNPTCR